MLAVTQGIFAYNGYGGAVYFAEETKNAARSIAKAVIWSAVITVATELVPLIAIMVAPARRPNSSVPAFPSRHSSPNAPVTPSPWWSCSRSPSP